mgnify:CR=1 FL=1
MNTIKIEIPEIPHGHGLSFKKGVADGLLGSNDNESTCHDTHEASYRRGCEVGKALKEEIAKQVKA